MRIEINIEVTHYQPDTTQEREDGSPMEIEFEAKMGAQDVSHYFTDKQVVSMVLSHFEHV